MHQLVTLAHITPVDLIPFVLTVVFTVAVIVSIIVLGKDS
jgi:hypothetical protein